MEPLIYQPKHTKTYWFIRIMLLFFLLGKAIIANREFLRDPDNLPYGLYTIGIYLILLFWFCVGQLRSITVAEDILINRVLLEPVRIPFGSTVVFSDDLIHLGPCSINTAGLANPKRLAKMLQRLADEGKLVFGNENPAEEPTGIRRLFSWSGPLPHLILMGYLLLDMFLHFTFIADGWDDLGVAALLFCLWYFPLRYRGRLAYDRVYPMH